MRSSLTGIDFNVVLLHGPLARYVKLWLVHAPGMPGTFSSPPPVSDPDMHHGTCATHVLWCMPGLLTSGFRWSKCRGKRSWHSQRMRNPQFYLSGKRPMAFAVSPLCCCWIQWNCFVDFNATKTRLFFNIQSTYTKFIPRKWYISNRAPIY